MDRNKPPSARAWAGVCVGVFAGMLALAYAAAPLYDMFCRVTGYGGTTQTAARAPGRILDRTVDIRLDTNVAPGAPISFRAAETTLSVRLGESRLVFFEVRNLSDRPTTVVATYNVTPHKTGQYFQKLECFCFQERTLAAGQAMELPVVFFVDPRLAEDRDTEEVSQITLSYTYFLAPEALKTADVKQGEPGRDVARP